MTAIPPPGPTLVVLAAGTGSRFGGLKQLEAVGPCGATLMDYAVFDAVRAGFSDVVFVVSEDMQSAFAETVAARYGDRFRIRTVPQRLGDVPGHVKAPAGRAKPWGTAQAVLAVAREVRGAFAVVNADDFYGSGAYEMVNRFLATEAAVPRPPWAVVAYPLRNTLSSFGGVSRAVCRVRGDWLTALKEVHDIAPRPGGGLTGRMAGGPITLAGDELVSMNMWAFTTEVFDILGRAFADFLAECDLEQDEFLLPTAIQSAMRRNEARVRVLLAAGSWFGMTHPQDRPAVEQALAALVAAGRYPEQLW